MSDHSLMTRMAFDALPEWERKLWKDERERFVSQYCLYPDLYWDAGRHEEIKPYALLIGGRQFHYTPANDIDNDWEMVRQGESWAIKRVREKANRNWEFVREGLSYYLPRAARAIAERDMREAGRWLGVLVHFVQDGGHELHALEGPDGVGFFALDRLVEPPAGEPHRTASMTMIELSNKKGDIRPYEPRLLGTSVREVIFRLYSAYYRLGRDSRLKHLPIVGALQRGDRAAAARLLREMDEDGARLTCDVIHTMTSMAAEHFRNDQLQDLSVVSLVDTYLLCRPWIASDPYRFTPLVPGACLTPDRKRAPLTLRAPDGRKRTFSRGWGSGAHVEMVLAWQLPAGVFETLEMTVGLHEPLGRNGCLQLVVELDGRTLSDDTISSRAPSVELSLSVRDGGYLRIVTRVATSDWTGPENNIVWGDPRLARASDAPVWEAE